MNENQSVEVTFSIDGKMWSTFHASAGKNGFQVVRRDDLPNFPVMVLRALSPDTQAVFDVVPRGTPSDSPNNGITWIDLCNADIKGNPNAPTVTARLGVRTNRADVGVRVFNGAKPVPFYIVMDKTDCAVVDVDGSMQFLFPVGVPEYRISDLPRADEYGDGMLIFVPDTSAGPCAAISFGGEWRTLPLGPAIS